MRNTLLVMILFAVCPFVTAAEQQISNKHLRVGYNPDNGTLRAASIDTGRTFIDGNFSDRSKGTARTINVKHQVLGQGKAIEITYGDGRSDRISLYRGIDFILIQPILHNDSDEEINFKNVDLLDAVLKLKTPADSLKALGTNGLDAVDGHPGSYVFLAVADPDTRSGIVGAWLSQDRGSGIVFSGKDGDNATMQARIDYGRLLVKPGAKVDGEIFVLGDFEDARIGLEKYADLTARYYQIKLKPQPDGYCTWYSKPHGKAADEKHIIELSEFAANELKPYGFDFVQIDDKWQEGERRNGPAKVFDRVAPNGPYKGGMKPVADKIVEMSLTAGIWWMPFAGDRMDPFFADKQGWFTRKPDGTPYYTAWGGTALDMTNPEAINYVGSLADRMANEWGYKYFKMDGLWMGTSTKQIYVNNGYRNDDHLGEQTVHNPDMTPIEAYRAGLKQVRRSAGDDTYFLGCCVSQNMRSFGASFGLVNAMRIGPDNGLQWDRLIRGPWHGSNRYFLHGRLWHNDPDPLYVRQSLPLEQARLICSWVSISGQLNVCSEWLPSLPSERLDMLKRTLPNHGKLPRPVDILESPIAKIWMLQDDSSGVQRTTLGLYNWSDKQAEKIDYSMSKLGLKPDATYVGFDYWGNKFVSPFKGKLSQEIDPGSCLVLSLREYGNKPVVVSTSRHITQGIVDITSEKWSGWGKKLSGKSLLVASDPYEIRIVVPTSKKPWKLKSFDVDDKTVKIIDEQQEGTTVRVSMVSTMSKEVKWAVLFKN